MIGSSRSISATSARRGVKKPRTRWNDCSPIFLLGRSEEHTSELQSHSNLHLPLFFFYNPPPPPISTPFPPPPPFPFPPPPRRATRREEAKDPLERLLANLLAR